LDIPGGGDYRGLFKEADVTAQVEARAAQVPGWIEAAAATLRSPEPPTVPTGKHCEDPYPCPFHKGCSAAEPKLERPISWLPGQLRKPAKALRDAGALQMDEVPDEFLSEAQLRVKTQTLAGEAYFDQAGAASALSECEYPLYFLDFETVNPAIPLWAGTRPYAQVPFQFSVHTVRQDGSMAHQDFLRADGEDPSSAFAEALVDTVGPSGAVVVYNAGFEGGRLKELASRFPQLADRLLAIAGRLFDLQPVAKAHYYHPLQQGSWSIKKVLPCLVPELQYDALGGVQDGGMAIDACMELLSPACTFERRADLEGQLRRYCRLDTLAMVGIWARFVGADRLLEAVLAAGRVGAEVERTSRGPKAAAT